MPDIKGFKAWRYNPKKVGSLAKVYAPPYDVISKKEQERLYGQHPQNVIRLELARQENGDNPENNPYTRAQADFNSWKQSGVLMQESEPALYVYVQEYLEQGKKKRRIGFVAAMKIDPKFVLKHENTLAAPKKDRFELIRHVNANLSSIFGLYEDPAKVVQKTLIQSLRQKPEVDVRVDGVRHLIYVEKRPKPLAAIRKAMKSKPMYIADGHHRFEVACQFKEHMQARAAKEQERDWEYVMTYFADAHNNPFLIYPTHRLLRFAGVESVVPKLSALGVVKPVKDLKALLKILEKNRQETKDKTYDFGFYTKKSGFHVLTLSKEQVKKIKKNPVDILDVAVLHDRVVRPIFGIDKIEKSDLIDFTRDAESAVTRINDAEFDVALFLRPTSLKEMILASKKGLKMPQKSTYFYPKLLSGLVFHSLSGHA